MIDYRSMPEVQGTIAHWEKARSEKPAGKRCGALGALRFDEGKHIVLGIVVTDTDLFELAVASMYGNTSPLSIPGARLEAIHFTESPEKQIVIDWLESKLAELKGR